MLLFTNAMQGQPYTRRLGSLVERNFVRAAPAGRRATTRRRSVHSYEIRGIGANHPSFFRAASVSISRFGRLAIACALGLEVGYLLDQGAHVAPSLVRNSVQLNLSAASFCAAYKLCFAL